MKLEPIMNEFPYFIHRNRKKKNIIHRFVVVNSAYLRLCSQIYVDNFKCQSETIQRRPILTHAASWRGARGLDPTNAAKYVARVIIFDSRRMPASIRHKTNTLKTAQTQAREFTFIFVRHTMRAHISLYHFAIIV